MFSVFAKTLLTATRTPTEFRDRADLPKLRWSAEDLPFRQHAGRRSGHDD